jgi:hypothetical protein
MAMPCPVCRASVEQGPQCRRCRADLSLLFALAEQREDALREARRSFAVGDYFMGRAHARHADYLHRDEQSARLISLGHLLLRRYDLALWTYRQFQKA